MALVLNGDGPVTGLTSLTFPGNAGAITGLANRALSSTVIGSGAVLQAVYAPTSITETNVSTRDTWTDCGVSAVITPTTASSKIIVSMNAYMLSYGTLTSGVVWALTRLKRNGTVIQAREFEGGQISSSYYHHKNVNPTVIFIDTPATTGSVTYTFEIMLPTTMNGQTIQNTLLRTKFGPSDGTGGGQIVLMEVAG